MIERIVHEDARRDGPATLNRKAGARRGHCGPDDEGGVEKMAAKRRKRDTPGSRYHNRSCPHLMRINAEMKRRTSSSGSICAIAATRQLLPGAHPTLTSQTQSNPVAPSRTRFSLCPLSFILSSHPVKPSQTQSNRFPTPIFVVRLPPASPYIVGCLAQYTTYGSLPLRRTLLGSQSAIRNRQSAIGNPQSAIPPNSTSSPPNRQMSMKMSEFCNLHFPSPLPLAHWTLR
jgi:hypothetical protein